MGWLLPPPPLCDSRIPRENAWPSKVRGDARSVTNALRPRRLSRAALCVVVHVEDEAVVPGVADLELEGRALLELAQQLDRRVEVHRHRGATVGEPLHPDLRCAVDAGGRVLEPTQLSE